MYVYNEPLVNLNRMLELNRFARTDIEGPFGPSSIWERSSFGVNVEIYRREELTVANPEIWIGYDGQPWAIRVPVQPISNLSWRVLRFMQKLASEPRKAT